MEGPRPVLPVRLRRCAGRGWRRRREVLHVPGDQAAVESW